MSQPAMALPPRDPAMQALIDRACRVIAPSWPLDQQIAVNPLWHLVDRPFLDAATEFQALSGTGFLRPAAAYGEAWKSGSITRQALRQALHEDGDRITVEAAIAALSRETTGTRGVPLPSDILDEALAHQRMPRWRETITQQVSQFCAAHFDDWQSDWTGTRGQGLFATWRRKLISDPLLESSMRAPLIRPRIQQIPEDPEAAIALVLERLGIDDEHAEAFLRCCLLRINGWAAWCAWLGWQARLRNGDDAHLKELLAIRASWELILDDGRRDAGSPWSAWRRSLWSARQVQDAGADEAARMAAIWLRAKEVSYQQSLAGLLAGPGRAGSEPAFRRPSAQLVFCIDVRSERFRRALEAASASLETRGFAGFFGLPIAYQRLGTSASRPQLPGLLAPALLATDSTGDGDRDARIASNRRRKLSMLEQARAYTRSPTGAFALVESTGLGFAGALLKRHFRCEASPLSSVGVSRHDYQALHPHLDVSDDAAVAAQGERLASILSAMSLTRGFGRLLVFVGHGSQSANNPLAASLDCGACGGQTGEVNARLLARLLNEPRLRVALAAHDIHIPADTVAVAALHNTTTDEVELFDTASMPASHAADLLQLRQDLLLAGQATRAERAPALGLDPEADRPDALLAALRDRARDWAETRPEWGLANNAAFIIAPRARTRGLDLDGRSFLHDYRGGDDPNGKILESIMTAPMVVTHWINLQYYASTVAPGRFGSGNKVLHNVVAGRIGVFEGNSGDLRVGLSRQSLHDGTRWMHEPLRLSVFIEAPREAIEAVLAKHQVVRDLVVNEWLHLLRIGAEGIEAFRQGHWVPWDTQTEPADD